MKKSFKNLAAILSAIILASSLSPVGAAGDEPTEIISIPPVTSPEIQRQMEEQVQHEFESIETPENRRMIEHLPLLSFSDIESATNRLEENACNFCHIYGISDGPITPEDIRESAEIVQQHMKENFDAFLPRSLFIFLSKKLKALYFISCLRYISANRLNSEGKIPRFYVIFLLCIIDPEMSRTLDAYCLNLRVRQGKVEIEFISKTQPLRRYII